MTYILMSRSPFQLNGRMHCVGKNENGERALRLVQLTKEEITGFEVIAMQRAEVRNSGQLWVIESTGGARQGIRKEESRMTKVFNLNSVVDF